MNKRRYHKGQAVYVRAVFADIKDYSSDNKGNLIRVRGKKGCLAIISDIPEETQITEYYGIDNLKGKRAMVSWKKLEPVPDHLKKVAEELELKYLAERI